MPIPTPKKDEKKNDFISRCIKTLADNEPDRFTSDQRKAICYKQWDNDKTDSAATLSDEPGIDNLLSKLGK